MTANRVITGVLILLVLFIGATGYYAYHLNGQVDRLNDRLVAFQTGQAAQVQAVSDNIGALKSSTENSLNSLQSQAAGSRSDIESLKNGLASAGDKISVISSNVTSLDKRVAGAEASVAGISGSIINPSGVYKNAVQAIVRITDGQATAGSGFIYDSVGHVVTAYHVVSALSPIYVMMYDGRISKASVLGYCPFSDVAVLKMDANPSITPLALGDSSKIIVGQPVLALGSPGDTDDPLALRDTLTSGIVSQTNRYVTVQNTAYANLIQFDTAINPGNSGGPLIDSNGKVVGVVQSRIDATKGDGISFAISSNKVKRVVESIISKGSFPYPYMGVGLSDITPLMAVQKSLDTTNGALVSSIVSGGPGAVGGLQTGDVIVSIDGVAVRNIADLVCYLGEFKSPGDIALVQVMRGTARMAWPIMVGTRPPN